MADNLKPGTIFDDSGGGWYYWDEAKTKSIGPFKSEEEAEKAYRDSKHIN